MRVSASRWSVRCLVEDVRVRVFAMPSAAGCDIVGSPSSKEARSPPLFPLFLPTRLVDIPVEGPIHAPRVC